MADDRDAQQREELQRKAAEELARTKKLVAVVSQGSTPAVDDLEGGASALHFEFALALGLGGRLRDTGRGLLGHGLATVATAGPDPAVLE
ncbi:MAG: hypothetical protein R6X02_02165, partial [Enhygromyxa sp.]